MFFREKTEQLSTWTVFKGEKEFLFVLERIVKFDNEWVVHSNKNITFGHNMGLLLTLLYVFLLQDFHGIYSVSIFSFSFYKNNFGIWSFSDDWEHVKVIEGVLTLGHVFFSKMRNYFNQRKKKKYNNYQFVVKNIYMVISFQEIFFVDYF